MLIYDDIFSWDGWGGKLRLASGKCKLRIYDESRDQSGDQVLLRPIVIISKDIGKESISIRSCSGHIATLVTQRFGINPRRMLWVEYYAASEYGIGKVHKIPERFDVVEFTWHDGKAIEPRWRPISPMMLDTVKKMVAGW
ncbi:MAG: hypothetical protein C0403_10330 [Desulfobacterium sp.]|nr:hypothetical protein [Desulfobacterium sp.]